MVPELNHRPWTGQASGRMVLGSMAPTGKGDDLNRETIMLVADETGGSYIRFLDRTTSVPARLS